MTAASRLLRRRALLFLLRGLRVCGQHFASMVTFAVLGVALMITLTSSSFYDGAARTREDSLPLESSGLELLKGMKRDEAFTTYRITFYVYSDEEQRRSLQEYLTAYSFYLRRQGYPDGIAEVNFLRVTSEADEEDARLLISQVGSWVAGRDIHLSVIDLR